MQQTLRALSKNGGALRSIFLVPRRIHTSSTAAIARTPCRDSSIVGGSKAEVTISNDIANSSRSISTGSVSNASFTITKPSANQFAKLPNLTPRAKAGFNTSISRKDLGFLPFESSIIFPTMDLSAVSVLPEISVPYLPDNLNPARPAEPESKARRPIIATVSAESSHIAAPYAMIAGFNVNFSFLKEETAAQQEEEDGMMRAFRGA